MTAKPLPLELSESAEDKASDSKGNPESTVSLASDVTKEFCDVKSKKLLIHQEEVDDSSSGLTTDGSASSQRFKKSSFQITRIVKTSEAGDSTDDIDDVTSIEDIGPSIIEKSANAKLEPDVFSLDTLHSPSSVVENLESLSSCQKHLCLKPSHSSRPRPSDINSRFKIVKIESNKPLRRGRWMCLEFVDPPHLSVSLEKQTKHDDTESLVSSCITSPIYYVQVEKEGPSSNLFAAAIIYSNGQPSLEPNPLPLRDSAMSQSSCSNPADSLALPGAMVQQQQQHDSGIEVMKRTSCLSSELSDPEAESGSSGHHHPIPSSYLLSHQPNSSLYDAGHRALVNGILFGSDGLTGISKDDERLVIRTGSEPTFGYSRVSDAVSPPLFSIVASTANASCPSGLIDNENSGGICALDNKIEQAMDLVKSHLMFAVHEEVELLKEQIKELTIKKGQLEYENTVLRASATEETLEKLHTSTLSMTGLS